MKIVVAAFGALALIGCAQSVQPLKGVPTTAVALPPLQLASAHTKIVFKWEYVDGESLTRGEGAVRLAAPDSARVDFFLGGLGGAAALIGDTLRANAGGMVKRFLPPVPLMWAAFGRLSIPPLPDTTVVTDGSLLRADIGRPVEWRVTARGDTLLSLAHIPGGKMAEQLTRSAGEVVYEVPSARRKLRLTIVRTEEGGTFDASIWYP
jgi:hypothetical protein